MHLTPDLVLPLEEAGDGTAKTFKIRGLKEGWATSQRAWTKVTEDTGVGNPKEATAEKGRQFFEKTTDMIADLSKIYIMPIFRICTNKHYVLC